MKKRNILLFPILFLMIVAILIWSNSNKQLADISPDALSANRHDPEDLEQEYVKTFKFDLKLNQADKSLIKTWVETYKDGQVMEKSLASLSYGPSSEKSLEDQVVFEIKMSPAGFEDGKVKLYGREAESQEVLIEDDFFDRNSVGYGGYTIGNNTRLKAGEEKILAVYRQIPHESNIESSNFIDGESIDKMIENDKTLILLKIMIEEIK